MRDSAEGAQSQEGADQAVALCQTYADLLGRQRTTNSPLSRWTKITSRSHEFVWLNGVFEEAGLMFGSDTSLDFSPGDPLYGDVHKMYGTAQLNPYEREILFGYPYVIGRVGDKSVRGPLLTLAIEIEALGSGLRIRSADDVVRFNSLPFRADNDTAAHEHSLNRVLEETPILPLTMQSLQAFAAVLSRELPDLRIDAALDGSLSETPKEPRSASALRLVDGAALFVA